MIRKGGRVIDGVWAGDAEVWSIAGRLFVVEGRGRERKKGRKGLPFVSNGYAPPDKTLWLTRGETSTTPHRLDRHLSFKENVFLGLACTAQF
jgi:hypothetical protein